MIGLINSNRRKPLIRVGKGRDIAHIMKKPIKSIVNIMIYVCQMYIGLISQKLITIWNYFINNKKASS